GRLGLGQCLGEVVAADDQAVEGVDAVGGVAGQRLGQLDRPAVYRQRLLDPLTLDQEQAVVAAGAGGPLAVGRRVGAVGGQPVDVLDGAAEQLLRLLGGPPRVGRVGLVGV